MLDKRWNTISDRLMHSFTKMFIFFFLFQRRYYLLAYSKNNQGQMCRVKHFLFFFNVRRFKTFVKYCYVCLDRCDNAIKQQYKKLTCLRFSIYTYRCIVLSVLIGVQARSFTYRAWNFNRVSRRVISSGTLKKHGLSRSGNYYTVIYAYCHFRKRGEGGRGGGERERASIVSRSSSDLSFTFAFH